MFDDEEENWAPQGRKRSKLNDGSKEDPSNGNNDPLDQNLNQHVQSLQSAGRVVEEMISKDEKFPELWDLFTSGATADYTIDHKPQFYRKKVVVLPEILLEQYSRTMIFSANRSVCVCMCVSVFLRESVCVCVCV